MLSVNKIFLIWFSSSLYLFFSLLFFYSQPSLFLVIFFTIFLCLFMPLRVFSVWQIFPFFIPFLSLCLLSCLCNRLYILPQVLNLSLLPLCQFLLALVFPFPAVPPASHTHSTSCSIPSLPCLLPWQDPFVRAVASALGCPCTPTSLSCHSLPWTGAGFAYLQFWGCIPK